MTFGDKLNIGIYNGKGLLFTQGEMTNLTYISYQKFIDYINQHPDENIPINQPVGFRPDNTLIESLTNYSKEDLIGRFQYLGLDKLPIDGIYRLVTIIETIFNFVLKEVLAEFPGKISSKKKFDADLILKVSNLDELKAIFVNDLLNDLSYKKPSEYAEEFAKITGVNLLEFPFFHKYIELKATRDIHIHNNGFANQIYLTKAGILARVKDGEFLPVDITYFLQSYECCLQIVEFLSEELHKIWPSEAYTERKAKSVEIGENALKESKIDEIIEEEKEKESE